MLVDSFLFNDEIDLAFARLSYLSPRVDYFVVAEASIDHSGNRKPFHWLQNSETFEQFNHKVLRLEICEDDLNMSNQYVFGIPNRSIGHIIGRSRQIIGEAVSKHFKDCHLIYSDVDEVPNLESLQELSTKVVLLEQSLRYYYANCMCITKPYERLPGSLIAHLPSMKNFNLNDQRNSVFKTQARYLGSYHGEDKTFSSPISKEFEKKFDFCDKPRIEREMDVHIRKNSGWHYSYLGGADGVLKKIKSSGHQEIFGNKKITKNEVIDAIKERRDFFGHGINFAFEAAECLAKQSPIDFMPQRYIYRANS